MPEPGAAPERRDGIGHHTGSVFWLGLAEAAVRGANVVLQFLLARELGKELYGTFAYAYSLALLVVAAAGIGLLEAFVRRAASSGQGVARELSEFFPLRAASAVLTAGILAALALAHRNDSSVLFAVGLFVLFRALTAFLASSFRAAEVVRKEFTLRCGEAALLLIVVLGAIRFRQGLVSISVLLAGASGVFLVLTVVVFGRVFPELRWRWPRSWAAAALRAAPLGLPAVIGSFLLRTDVILIQKFARNAARTAEYAAGVNVVLGVGLVPATIAAALFPALSRRSKNVGRRLALIGTAGFLLLGGALALGLSWQAERIVRLAYGSAFGSAAGVLVSLSPFILFLSPTIFAASILASRNETFALAALAVLPLVLKIVVDIRLLPGSFSDVARSSTILQALTFIAAVVAMTLSVKSSDNFQSTDK